MAKHKLQGFIKTVNDPISVGTGTTMKQTIILFVPGFVNQFQEKVGRDQEWEITILNDSIDKFNIHSRHVREKVEVEVYIESYPWTNPTTEKISYIINCRLADIKYIPKQNRPSGPVNNTTAPTTSNVNTSTPGEDDDLPF